MNKYIVKGNVLVKFNGSESVVSIPEEVEEIGESVFEECMCLTKVNIPGSVKKIGESAFYGCENLKDLTLSEGIEAIGDRAFAECVHLKKVKIPGSVKKISYALFSSCEDLEEVIIKNGVEVIGETPFFVCSSLKRIVIPESVRDIYDYDYIDKCHISKNNLYYKILNNTLFSKNGKHLYAYCGNEEVYSVPAGVESIERDAFSKCETLREVYFPEGVEKIGERVFHGCTALEKVNIPDGGLKIPKKSFEHCDNLEIVGDLEKIEKHVLDYKETFRVFHKTFYNMYRPFKYVGYISQGVPLLFYVNIIVNAKGEVSGIVNDVGEKIHFDSEEFKELNFVNKVLLVLLSLEHSELLNDDEIKYYKKYLSHLGLKISKDLIDKKAFNTLRMAVKYNIIKKNNFYKLMEYSQNSTIKGWLMEYGKKEFNLKYTPKEEDEKYDEFFASKGDVLCEYSGRVAHLVIPGKFKKIASAVFGELRALKKVVIENGVEEICKSAFENCYGLEEVTVPGSVKKIDDQAFKNCKSLKRVFLSEGVEELGNSVFTDCHAELLVDIPDSVRYIAPETIREANIKISHKNPYFLLRGKCLFSGDMKKMYCYEGDEKEYSIPNSVEEICEGTFWRNSIIRRINVPRSVRKIATGAIYRCWRLEHIDIKNYSIDIEKDALCRNSGLNIVGDVERIKKIDFVFNNLNCLYTFRNPWKFIPEVYAESSIAVCVSEEGTIQDSFVKHYKGKYRYEKICHAFLQIKYVKDLSEKDRKNYIELLRESISIQKFLYNREINVLKDLFKYGVIHSENIDELLKTVKKIKEWNGQKREEIVEIEEFLQHCKDTLNQKEDSQVKKRQDEKENITLIEEGTLKSFNGRKRKVHVPQTVTKIGKKAFKNKGYMSEIILPEGLEEIDDEAFAGCRMKIINIPDTVTKIGKEAFRGCSNLESIEIPDSITELNERCFAECKKLKRIKLPLKLKDIKEECFFKCKELCELNYIEELKSIGPRAFKYCRKIDQTIIFEEGLESIEEEAFMGCALLEKIVIPGSVKKVGKSTFSGVTTPKIWDFKVIGYNYDTVGIESIQLGDGIREIEDKAFYLCNTIKEIDVPGSVKRLGKYAFAIPDDLLESKYYGDSDLEKTTIREGVEIIDEGAFLNCVNMHSICIPYSIKRIEKAAFRNCRCLQEEVSITNKQIYINESAFSGCFNTRKIGDLEKINNIALDYNPKEDQL